MKLRRRRCVGHGSWSRIYLRGYAFVVPWTIERTTRALRRGLASPKHQLVRLPGQGREVYINAGQFTIAEPWPAGRLGAISVRARREYREWKAAQ